MKKYLHIIPIISLLVLQACVETEPVSPIPEISFESFELLDGVDTLDNLIKIGRLKFTFIDGDADFGLDTKFDSMASDEDNYNIFLIPFEKIDTNYSAIELDTSNPPPYYRVTNDTPLQRVGQNKTIKGTITIDIQYLIIPEYDTMRYDFYIVDRAYNKSNIESTRDIGFKGVSLPTIDDF